MENSETSHPIDLKGELPTKKAPTIKWVGQTCWYEMVNVRLDPCNSC